MKLSFPATGFVLLLAGCCYGSSFIVPVFGWTTRSTSRVPPPRQYHHHHQRRTNPCWKKQFYLSTSLLHTSENIAATEMTESHERIMPSLLLHDNNIACCWSSTATSLAGDYSVVLSTEKEENGDDRASHHHFQWSLFAIDHVVAEAAAAVGEEEGMIIRADGAHSLKALQQSSPPLQSSLKPSVVLSCTWSSLRTANITLSYDKDNTSSATVDDIMDLLDVLQRILVQWSWAALRNRVAAVVDDDDDMANSSKNPCTISFFQQHHNAIDLSLDSGLDELFSGLVDGDDISSIEWVEMVTGSGQALGSVPRRLVHAFNLLHRGIGLFVTKDRPIITDTICTTTSEQIAVDDFPSLYVHRRSATKRIFPSLYDMFVGGVSLAGEPPELTARREVAEELGLDRALDETEEWDSAAPILTCTVCTAYNRCVVTLFSYTMNTQTEKITWQEEEVEWGNFVPYSVIVAAADRSIQRLASDEKWPGTPYPPIQSEYQRSLPPGVVLECEGVDDWKEWDFVPDGLLVWEAWLKFLERSRDQATEQ